MWSVPRPAPFPLPLRHGRGLLLLGALALGGCAEAVPDSASGASSALAGETVAVARLCLERDFASAAVAEGLRARGYVAPVPPVLVPADRAIPLQVETARPCTLLVERDLARGVTGALRNALQQQGFKRVGGEAGVWSDGDRRVRIDRNRVQGKVALSLSRTG